MKNETRQIGKVALAIVLGMYFNTTSAQTNNVGIGTNSPDPSAILELQATDKGILIPRTDTNLIVAPATGLLIYENADNTFYYFDGTNWVAFGGSGVGPTGPAGPSGPTGPTGADGALNAWSLTGNAGTSPPTNFIGTTDANDWAIHTTGTERVRVMSGGRIGVNMSAPVYQLDVAAPTYGIRSETTGLITTSIYGHNSNATNGYGIVGQADGSSVFASVGVKGISENGGDALQTDGPSHFNVDGQDFDFWVQGLTDVNLFYGDAGNDRIGIGTASPGAKLEVTGQVKITGGAPGSGKVLTSDATGLASWATPSGGGGATLQTAYDAGNTISTTASRPIAFTINQTSSPFTVDGTNANLRVGIGITNPTAYFHYERTSSIGMWEVEWTDNGTSDGLMRILNSAIGNANRVLLGVTTYNGNGFTPAGIEGLAIETTGTAYGVIGSSNSGDGIGVRGYNLGTAGAGGGYGVRGETAQTGGTGVFGDNFNLLGTGVAGNGNNVFPQVPAAGAGGSFTGDVNGAFAKFNTGGAGQGLLVQDDFGAQWQVGYWDGTQYRKIEGNGTLNTVVKDLNGNRIVLSAPETPENLFEDYGVGQLNNGFAHIEIDPIFAKNITVNEKHPLRVFIQLENACDGVYVSNKSSTGFDVIELNGGSSDAKFMYHIIGNRADEVMESGRIARYADVRFAPAAKIQKINDLQRGPKREGPIEAGYKSLANEQE